MAQDVIVRGVTYTGVEKLSLPVSGGSALFRDTSDADASASDVLSGKKAYNANGEINGSMTNQGAASGTISDKDTPFQIPQGYHNGSGSVEIAAAQKALLIPGNIRDSVTILGVTGDYTGGGGGPTSADALLIVKAPSGSTVTATKGGTTLSPTLWTTAADANFECALFVIGSALFDAQNAWTVTASLGTNTASDTVIINSNKQYDLELSFSLWLFKAGSGAVVQFGTNNRSQVVTNITSDYIDTVCNNSTQQGSLYTANTVDLTEFAALHFSIYCTYEPVNSINYGLRMHVTSNQPVADTSNPAAVAKLEFNVNSAFTEYAIDVSSISGSYYIGIWGVGSYKCNNIWLE